MAFGIVSPGRAGAPFVTDDPEPTERGHWEIYAYAEGLRAERLTEGEGGLDINYGAAPDLQLTLGLPLNYDSEHDDRIAAGAVEFGAKLRIVHQSDGGLWPDIAVSPTVIAPTARFGSNRWGALLPVWAQKDFGALSVFGGGGYQINPGGGGRDFWVGGLGAQWQVNDRLALGAEVYHHTHDAEDTQAFTGLNVGATWRVSPHWSILASAGPGLQHAREGGRVTGYLALKADY